MNSNYNGVLEYILRITSTWLLKAEPMRTFLKQVCDSTLDIQNPIYKPYLLESVMIDFLEVKIQRNVTYTHTNSVIHIVVVSVKI